MTEVNKHPTQLGGQGRQAGGYSLRKSLENQGVTTEEEMRQHLAKIYSVAQRKPKIDITRYRVNK